MAGVWLGFFSYVIVPEESEKKWKITKKGRQIFWPPPF
jgi:hypothetical protein